MTTRYSHQGIFQLLLISSFAVRLFFSSKIGIHSDEALSALLCDNYNQNPFASFPLFSYLLQPFRSLEAPHLLRLPSIIIFSFSLLILYNLARRLFSSSAGLLTVIIIHLLPLHLIIGASATEHSVIFFIFCALWASARAFQKSPSAFSALLPGILFGVGLCLSPLFILCAIPLCSISLANYSKKEKYLPYATLFIFTALPFILIFALSNSCSIDSFSTLSCVKPCLIVSNSS